MDNQAASSQPSAAEGSEAQPFGGTDNATGAEQMTPLSGELGPNGLPVHPPQGDPGAKVDSDLILDTFFGEGNKEPNSDEGQGQGSNSSDGQSKEAAPSPKAAPAANGEEGSPKPGPSSTQQQPGQEQKPAGEAAPQTPGQAQPGASPEQPAPAQLSIEDRLALASVAALKEQNTQLLERLRAFEKGGAAPQAQPGQQGQGQQPQPGEQPTQPGVPPEEQIRLVVPDALYDQITNEDPAIAKQGMSFLITAVAQNAVKAALAAVPQIVDQRVSAVTQALEQGRQAASMEEQYYEAFPAHKNELFKPLIQSVVQEKYKQFPGAAWNEDMIGAVGATVTAKLKELGIDPLQVQQAPDDGQDQGGNGQGQGGKQPRPKPAPMLDSSTRAGQGGVPQDAGDFIASTFG